MNNIALYVLIAVSCYAVFRVIREAKSYRTSWNISWYTAFKHHVEWKHQITFYVGWLLLIIVAWAVVWVIANYGCSLLKGIEC